MGTSLVDVDGSSSTSLPKERKSCGGMKQLAQKKRQKSERTVVDDGGGIAETRRKSEVAAGSSLQIKANL
ncbi:hypothetical protein [Allocoleopsis sp.]|uniref:hypothetical protein n=1 Tax=Allocoleopsis sp. TaxID=3088169 RepID=UPI002FD7574C